MNNKEFAQKYAGQDMQIKAGVMGLTLHGHKPIMYPIFIGTLVGYCTKLDAVAISSVCGFINHYSSIYNIEQFNQHLNIGSIVKVSDVLISNNFVNYYHKILEPCDPTLTLLNDNKQVKVAACKICKSLTHRYGKINICSNEKCKSRK